jgi:hypothetical protein
VHWWYSPAKASNHSFSYLFHSLTLTRLVCAAQQWARQQTAYRLTQCALSYALAHTAPTVTIQSAQEQIPLRVVPDALLCFERNDGEKYPLIIEVDRGTEFQERFKKHVTARTQLVRSGGHKHYLGIDAVCIAYITPGVTSDYRASRLKSMRQWTKEVVEAEIFGKNRQAWMERFRFTSLAYEEIYERINELMTENVWYPPDGETKVPLWSESPTNPHEENEHGPHTTADCDQAND